MERSLEDVRQEAQAKRQAPAEIEPYAITVDGHRVVLRNPSDIPAQEAERARGGASGQIRLLTASRQDYDRLWTKLKHWPQADVLALAEDIIGHYDDQESGKGRSSTSSGVTPTK